MDVEFAGTGGPQGWPQPGCGCASCALARRSGAVRAPAEIVLDGIVRISFPAGPGNLLTAPAGYLAAQVTGGLEVTAPDGSRLLCAAGPGAAPIPAAGAAPYDAIFLDLLGDPSQLGGLRRQGLMTDKTIVAVIHVDHRLRSTRELVRRCRLWGVIAAADGDHLAVRSREPPDWRGGPRARPERDPRGRREGRGGWPAQDVLGERAMQSASGARHLLAAPARPRPWRALVLGGARSGKSAEAELRLAAEPEVTYVAAAGPAPGADAEWAARVAAHQARRPRWWRTVETTDVASVLRASEGAVLIDSIGSWLAAVLDQVGTWCHQPGDPQVASRLAARITELAGAWRDTRCHVVAVSEEAGWGVVPGTESGRIFRDELGSLNQLLAAQSEEAVLVVAGRALSLPG